MGKVVLMEKWPVLGRHERAVVWLRVWADLGRAPRTMDAYARGLVIGITRGTTRGHLARAALESIAFQVADLLEAVGGDAGIALAELRVDGGAAANNALLQFQADLLGVPVVRPEVTETTALGAAYLAGLAVGFWSSLDEIGRQWKVERRFEPAMARADAERLRERWREAVSRAKGWIPAGSGT